MHLSILEKCVVGYEFEVSQPQVILWEIDGVKHEPVEDLIIEVPEEYVGIVMERLGPVRVRWSICRKRRMAWCAGVLYPTKVCSVYGLN